MQEPLDTRILHPTYLLPHQQSPTVSGRMRRTRVRAGRRSGHEARACGRGGSPPRPMSREIEAEVVVRQQFNHDGDVLLFAFRKPGPPVPELVRLLDIPSHQAVHSFSGMMSRHRQHPGELTGVRAAALWSLPKNADIAIRAADLAHALREGLRRGKSAHQRCQEFSYALRKSALDMPDWVHMVLRVDAFSVEWPGIVSGVTLPSGFFRLMATWLPLRTVSNPSA